jgi:hypothetical protein
MRLLLNEGFTVLSGRYMEVCYYCFFSQLMEANFQVWKEDPMIERITDTVKGSASLPSYIWSSESINESGDT